MATNSTSPVLGSRTIAVFVGFTEQHALKVFTLLGWSHIAFPDTAQQTAYSIVAAA